MASKHPRYFTGSWKIRFFLYLHAFFLFFRKKPPLFQPEKIKKILICNWATLGDILVVTSVLPALKQKWPDAKIGFLTSPDSKIAIENHPLIDKIHVASPWKQEAIRRSLFARLRLVLHGLKFKYASLIQDLTRENYDLAIDFHPFFPNVSCILKEIPIPYVVTFSSAGFHPPHSYTVNFPEKLGYLPKMYSHLLGSLGIEGKSLKPCFYFIEAPPIIDQGYIILHGGTTEERREWRLDHWKSLASKLSSEGFKIVFTGKGAREQEVIAAISAVCPGSINLCNQLDWNGFLSVIKNAQAIISVNTVTVHLAAALGTPVLGLFLSTAYLELWLPDSGACSFLIQDTHMAYLSDPSFLTNHPKAHVVSEITPENAYIDFMRTLELVK